MFKKNKTFVSIMIALLLLTILASTTFAAPAAGERQLLLKGSLQATETHLVTPPTMLVDATGSGNATQLGNFTMAFQAEVYLPTLFAASESATVVAADGSTLFGEGSGQGTLTETPGVVSIVETYTITGGTGRFAGASGNFTVERLIDRATLISSGTISGTIVLP
jgi:hypothetical protein